MGANIHIKDRESLSMTDVSEVLSFDNDFISVATALGKVEIEGDGLKIISMSSESGEMFLVGRIDGVYYSKMPSKKGIFSKGVK